MPSYEPVTAVLRGLDVLQAVSLTGLASVNDVHARTGINKPTIVRMLETLQHAGFVQRADDGSSRYRVTGATLSLSLGYDAMDEIAARTAPILEMLHQRIGWPSDVAIFDERAMLVVATSRGRGRFFFNRRPGYRAPILATSLGLAAISGFDAPALDALAATLSQSADPWDEPARMGTISAVAAEVHARGFAQMHPAYREREYDGSVDTIGVAIPLAGQTKAAINAMYSTAALSREQAVETILPALQDAARQIAEAWPPA